MQNESTPPAPLSPFRLVAERHRCAECRNEFSKDDLMAFSTFFVCAACKPIALAKLTSGHVVGSLARDRKKLIIATGTEFPDHCVRCNEPCGGYRVKRKLSWHRPGYYAYLMLVFVLGIIGLLLYALIAARVRKTSTLMVPLCPAHRRRRNWGIGWTIASAVIGLGFFAAAIVVAVGPPGTANSGFVGLMCILGVVAVVAGIILLKIFYGVLTPTKITPEQIIVKGAREPFLSQLPVWESA